MNKTLIYDLPTRFSHWLFVVLFLTAFVIGNTADDESRLFAWHIFAGLTLTFLVLLRLVWGFFGSTHARLLNFDLSPNHLLQYIRGVLSGDLRRWAGHNPASSWAAICMFALALALGISGFLIASKLGPKGTKEVHELLANALLVVAIVHVAGVLLHTIRFKDWIGLSMVNGYKQGVAQDAGIVHTNFAAALVLIACIATFWIYLLINFDSSSRKLTFLGTSLSLGEDEKHEHHKHKARNASAPLPQEKSNSSDGDD